MLTSWIDKALLSLVGLTFMVMVGFGAKEEILAGKNDFAPLYNGTHLVGTPHLYSAEHNYELLEKHVGGTNPSLRYTRLPYHAAFLWPLGRLPYLAAYTIWVLLGFSALVAFALLWRVPSTGDALVFTALSLPAFQSLMNGQDVPLLLLWVALAVHFEKKDKPFTAGCILTLCAAKYHLFALLPLLLIGQRRWRMTAGFAAGAACLLAISFAAAGLNWPFEYYATLTDGRVHPEPAKMPNFHGLLVEAPLSGLLQVLASGVVAIATWQIVRRTTFLYGLAVVLIGGLLISYHAYLSDCAVLLPACTVVYSQTKSRWVQLLAALLLTPFIYFLLIAPPPAPHGLRLVIVALFCGAVIEGLRASVRREEALATT